jgi:hypothetical protein
MWIHTREHTVTPWILIEQVALEDLADQLLRDLPLTSEV